MQDDFCIMASALHVVRSWIPFRSVKLRQLQRQASASNSGFLAGEHMVAEDGFLEGRF